MADTLNEQVFAGKFLLGICLGMQIICATSEEGGPLDGVGGASIIARP